MDGFGGFAAGEFEPITAFEPKVKTGAGDLGASDVGFTMAYVD